MDVFIYQADLLCEDCGYQVVGDCRLSKIKDTGDSDDYPQGPYPDGGGESDIPNHCGNCGVFLENPLTSEGCQYVKEAEGEIADMWREYYGIKRDSKEED